MPEAPTSSSDEATARAYLSSSRVLHLVHRALNAAVRDRAPNPLLHMARSLRNERLLSTGATTLQPVACDEAAEQPTAHDERHGEPLKKPELVHPPRPVPTTWISSASGGWLEALEAPLRGEQPLRELLAEYAVDASEWSASGGSLTIPELLAELRAGEAAL